MFNVFFPACVFFLLGILNILNVLFHYYLFLSLVKGEEYLPFFLVCEKMSTLFCVLLTFSDSLSEINQ